MNTDPTVKQALSTKKAVTIVGSTLAFMIVALTVTAGSDSGPSVEIPERNILVVDSGSGAKFETDLPLNQAEHQVRVNGEYIHLNLDTKEVIESGWHLTKMPIDSDSPIQAYDLTPVK